jgi:hypothetical protein
MITKYDDNLNKKIGCKNENRNNKFKSKIIER